MPSHDREDDETGRDGDELPPGGKPLISYGGAMAAYAVLGAVCFFTLHGDALYIALLIIGALAIKTWLAQAKSRIE